MTSPQSLNYYMPPEWYQHECCWMQWPHEDPNRNSYLEVESWSHFDFEKEDINGLKLQKRYLILKK